MPLISSMPTLRSPTVGRSMSKRMRAIAEPMIAMSTRCMASAPIVAPTSSTTLSPRSVGHRAAIAGRSIWAMVLRQIFDIAMRAPVLPAETAASASPSRTAWIASHMEEVRRPARRGAEPHGGGAPPSPHRLARLVLHAHGDVGVAKLDGVLERGLRVEKRPDDGLVAEHEETQAGMALQCKRRPRNHHGGAVIAAHRVERDPHWLRHECLAFPGGENGGK